MAKRPPINPNHVDWSGENPGMYLKESADGPFVTLASFFRVVKSPHGRGHALLLLESPNTARPPAGHFNLCLSDNEPLARWLVQEFASHFGAFRGAAGMGGLAYLPLQKVESVGDAKTSYGEKITGSGISVELTWDQLGDTFMVEYAPQHSATGKHEMFSLFVNCGEARAVINGKQLPGKVVPREMQGKASTSAFLAFSETWVKAL